MSKNNSCPTVNVVKLDDFHREFHTTLLLKWYYMGTYAKMTIFLFTWYLRCVVLEHSGGGSWGVVQKKNIYCYFSITQKILIILFKINWKSCLHSSLHQYANPPPLSACFTKKSVLFTKDVTSIYQPHKWQNANNLLVMNPNF